MRLSKSLPLLLSTSVAVAFPLVDLTKRQYCAEGSTVCAAFCCQPGEQCVYDPSTDSGYNCKLTSDTSFQPVSNAIFTYTVNPTPTVLVISFAGGPDPTPVATPGNTPAYTPGNTPGNTPGITPTGPLIPPTQPTDSTTTVVIPGTSTGAFITAIPTNTDAVLVPQPVGVGSGGLTAGQIGGIIGGVIGGLGLLALLILWCCLYGLCAAFGGRRHGSDSDYEDHKTWKSFVPVALAGGALAANRHRHSHHSATTITTEKRKSGSSGLGKGILGGLGAAWLAHKFAGDKHEYKPPKEQLHAASSYTGTSSYTSTSSSSRGHSTVSSSYLSGSSSSSGYMSNDSRHPPPARHPPPGRYR
ncbi:hypothetical protein DRE_01171 [Drechslerella stenobrocha 248]|uniref:Uncharacterized protein n=1 Tax=Drechslerella stenobrocha 248 TaxID=1043628 RepID=W7I6D6_9PEZI|nr:hypothetical protein DRE_01171 [Drechslerella stenobrocha 248]